jgi:hypothetical protein
MPYSQKNNPMKMMKSALKMYKDDKKSGMHRDSAMYAHSPMHSGHSPMEMDHGMKRESSMYMKDGMHRESVKQEKKDLMEYNPVDDRAGSPATAAKPDFPDIDGDGNTTESMKKAAADKKKGSPATKYDRVVLGGNKGDKSKTKPGKKDYMGKK